MCFDHLNPLNPVQAKDAWLVSQVAPGIHDGGAKGLDGDLAPDRKGTGPCDAGVVDLHLVTGPRGGVQHSAELGPPVSVSLHGLDVIDQIADRHVLSGVDLGEHGPEDAERCLGIGQGTIQGGMGQ